MAKQTPVPAVTYLRVSSQHQVDGHGIERQREACEAYARKHGFAIVEEYRDEGVSGTLEPAYRPGLQALIGRLHLNGVRVVLVEGPDRLGRDSEVGPAVRLALRKVDGLRLIRVDRGSNMLDEGERGQNTLDDFVADQARRLLVRRMADGRARIRASGQTCEGRKPFGFKAGEAETIARIKALRAKGKSLRAIGAMLDDEGRSTRSGKPWSATAIANILARAKVAKRTKLAHRSKRAKPRSGR
jgi:DNA invertase Pin-like site-specific DNA recombinase